MMFPTGESFPVSMSSGFLNRHLVSGGSSREQRLWRIVSPFSHCSKYRTHFSQATRHLNILTVTNSDNEAAENGLCIRRAAVSADHPGGFWQQGACCWTWWHLKGLYVKLRFSWFSCINTTITTLPNGMGGRWKRPRLRRPARAELATVFRCCSVSVRHGRTIDRPAEKLLKYLTPNETVNYFSLLHTNSPTFFVRLCHTGQISLTEFMEGAQKDEWVMNLFKLDVNPTSWVIQNCASPPWCHPCLGHCPHALAWGWQRTAVSVPRVWRVRLSLHVELLAIWSWRAANFFTASVSGICSAGPALSKQTVYMDEVCW